MDQLGASVHRQHVAEAGEDPRREALADERGQSPRRQVDREAVEHDLVPVRDACLGDRPLQLCDGRGLGRAEAGEVGARRARRDVEPRAGERALEIALVERERRLRQLHDHADVRVAVTAHGGDTGADPGHLELAEIALDGPEAGGRGDGECERRRG